MFHNTLYEIGKFIKICFCISGTQSRELQAAHRKRVNCNKFFPKQRTALDEMISAERKQKEDENSSTPATTDEEPVVLRTKVTVHPVTYATDSSSADATYNVKKFEDPFPDSPKVSKTVDGLNIKKSISEKNKETSKESEIPLEKGESSKGGNALKGSADSHSDDGENPSSDLFHSSSELTDSEDVTFPLSGFVTKKSNDLVEI